MTTSPPVCRLEEVVDPARPVTYGIVLPGPDVPDGTPYIRVVDMQGGTVSTTGLRRTTAEIARKYRRSEVRPGDVLLSIRGHVGRVAIVPEGLEGANLTQDTARIAVRGCEPRYLAWALRSPALQRWMVQRTKGVAVQGINLADVKEIPVAVPPLPEQRRIVAFLDEADALRRKRRESLALLDDLLRVTFLDMFGDPVTNPRRWPEVPLASVVVDGFRNGLSPASAGTVAGRVLTLSAITGAAFDSSKAKDAVFDRVPDAGQFATEGLFLICRGNGNISLVGRGKTAHAAAADIVFPDTMIACRPRGDRLDGSYLAAIWDSRAVRAQMESGARTTNGTYKVNQQVLADIRFPLPPRAEQRRFASVASTIREQTVAASRSAQGTDDLFESLLYRVFGAPGDPDAS